MIGEIHPYYEDIAIVKWLNRTFGYSITVPEFQAPDSPWDEHHLRKHFDYTSAYHDRSIENKVKARDKKILKRLLNKGYIGPAVEFGDSDD